MFYVSHFIIHLKNKLIFSQNLLKIINNRKKNLCNFFNKIKKEKLNIYQTAQNTHTRG